MKILRALNNKAAWLACGALISIMLIICINVFLRSTLNISILGTIELVGILSAIMISLGLAYTQIHGGHVAIAVVVPRLPRRARTVIHCINWLLSLVFFLIVTWRAVVHSKNLWFDGEETEILDFPLYLVAGIITIGFALLCLTLFADFMKALREVRK